MVHKKFIVHYSDINVSKHSEFYFLSNFPKMFFELIPSFLKSDQRKKNVPIIGMFDHCPTTSALSSEFCPIMDEKKKCSLFSKHSF